MTINQADHIDDNRRRQSLMAAGGLLGALAASSCCILPLALFGLGVSGAWIGNFTRLAPYQPCFVAVTLAFLACADGEACAHPLPNRFVKISLILATILVVAALGLDVITPLFL